MTPKMEAALAAAARADAKGGLCYTVAGWIDPSDCWTHHGPVIVSRLVHDRGYLAEAGARGRGPKSRRVITEKGRAYLAATDNCPGHVASEADPKVCRRCGIHIDELRPDEADPINLQGSGPAPIEPREG